MARRQSARGNTTLSPILSQIEAIGTDLSVATTATAWPAEPLKACISDAVLMKRRVNQLLRQVETLINNLKQQATLPSQPEGKGLVPRQLHESDGHYTGKIKFELAQLRAQTVPTIGQVVEEFPQCKELGYCKVTVGEKVIRSMNLQKISGSRLDQLEGFQSKTVHLRPRKKGDPLYELACSSLIDEDDQAGSFRVPDLCQQGEALDSRELLLSTVRDARAGEGQSYLVMPAESYPLRLGSTGLDPELLDCGEQLKRTVGWIPGVHTAYLYISASRGSNSPLHVEDGFLGSVNIVLAGAPKVWLMVEPCYRKELEHRARRYLVQDRGKKEEDEDERQGTDQGRECSQFVRHLSTLLSPELLDAWDIPYRIVSCAAGEMMVTFSEAYHQVVNAGPNLALAINFAESEWTGPPEEYRFCSRGENRCGAHSITLAQLQVRRPSCDSEQGPTGESHTESQATDGPPNARQKQDLDLTPGEVDDAINMFLEGTPKESPSGSEPFLDGQLPKARTQSRPPNTLDEPDEHPSNTRLSSGPPEILRECANRSSNAQTPPEPPETPGAPGDHPANTQTSPESPEPPSALGDRSSDTRTPSKAPETPESSCGESRGISTPPTVQTGQDVQQNGKAGNERACDTSAVDVVVLSSDDKDDKADAMERPPDGPGPETTVGETVETRLNHLIEQVLPFNQGLGTFRKTIECFRLNSKLNDDAITLTLKKILPESVEILIASHAIRNVPASGICFRHAAADVQSVPPALVYELGSTHLCIACNVESDSLECVWEGSGNHWILVVVDFAGKRVHVFGKEGGHDEKAKAIACNIGDFVNNHRIAKGLSAVCWSDPETHRLHPTGSFPDCYNCGIAVISRAEGFIYPDKALKISNNASAAELSNKLNELRAVYLESILRRCQRVMDDENEKLFLTPVSKSKKRPSPFPDRTPTKVTVKREHLRQRATSPPPPPLTVLFPQPETQRWEACLLRAAESGGFRSKDILKAFRSAPASQSVLKRVRILQYICEVANTEVLLKIKDIVHEPMALEDPANHTDQDLINLYLQIRKYDKVSFLAQLTKFKCQLFYYEKFEEEKASKQTKMIAEKKKHDTQRRSNQRKGLPLPVRSDGNGKSGQSADAWVRNDYARRIVSRTKLDEITVRNEVNQNLKEGRTLNCLLGPRCGRGDRRKSRFLLLLPLYGTGNRRPALDVMAHGPPEQVGDLSRSISAREILGLSEEAARIFGGLLLTARPELEEIESYLPGADSTYPRLHQTILDDPGDFIPPSSSYLTVVSDGEIRETKPKDVARLFKPVYSRQLQLEFREGKYL